MKSLDEDDPDLKLNLFNEPLIRRVPEQKMHFTIASHKSSQKITHTSRHPSVGLKKVAFYELQALTISSSSSSYFT